MISVNDIVWRLTPKHTHTFTFYISFVWFKMCHKIVLSVDALVFKDISYINLCEACDHKDQIYIENVQVPNEKKYL